MSLLLAALRTPALYPVLVGLWWWPFVRPDTNRQVLEEASHPDYTAFTQQDVDWVVAQFGIAQVAVHPDLYRRMQILKAQQAAAQAEIKSRRVTSTGNKMTVSLLNMLTKGKGGTQYVLEAGERVVPLALLDAYSGEIERRTRPPVPKGRGCASPPNPGRKSLS